MNQQEKFKKGLIRVNNEPVSGDYILKDSDFITTKTHRHETPVIALPLKIIHDADEMLVIDKPPSIPVLLIMKAFFFINSNFLLLLDSWLWPIYSKFCRRYS